MMMPQSSLAKNKKGPSYHCRSPLGVGKPSCCVCVCVCVCYTKIRNLYNSARWQILRCAKIELLRLNVGHSRKHEEAKLSVVTHWSPFGVGKPSFSVEMRNFY